VLWRNWLANREDEEQKITSKFEGKLATFIKWKERSQRQIAKQNSARD
jgi:hypothetical protein